MPISVLEQLLLYQKVQRTLLPFQTYSENLQKVYHCKILYPSMFFCAAEKIGEEMNLVLLQSDYSYKGNEIY